MSTTTPARTAATNAHSLSKGDVLAEGFAGVAVIDIDKGGTFVALALQSLQTGRIEARTLPVTACVEIVHPDDRGRALPTRR